MKYLKLFLKEALSFGRGKRPTLRWGVKKPQFVHTFNPVMYLISILSTSFSWFWTWGGKRNSIKGNSKFSPSLSWKSLYYSCRLRINYKILNMAYTVLHNLTPNLLFLDSSLIILLKSFETTVISKWSNISKDKIQVCFWFLPIWLCIWLFSARNASPFSLSGLFPFFKIQCKCHHIVHIAFL